jgi:F-box/leucine-rich repeat protein 2/20
VETLKLRALPAFVSSTCYSVIAKHMTKLKYLDVSLCRNLLAAALLDLAQPELQTLLAAKIPSMDDATVSGVMQSFPKLRDLDLGYSRNITDAAFAKWPGESVGGTQLRTLRLSSCVRLTDQACWNLVAKVQELECLEMASIGGNLREAGLIKLLETLPELRKIDLEDATNLSDRVIAALTPGRNSHGKYAFSPLEHAVLTNLPEVTEPALIRLVRACPSLKIVECSNSFHVSDAFIKAFLLQTRRNRLSGAEVSVVDCRNIGRRPVRDYNLLIRPRRGIADYANRHFGYIDDAEVRGNTITECDDIRT